MDSSRTMALLLVASVACVAAAGQAPCSGCHEAQRRAWALSMHARSTQDPVYRAMRAWAREDAGEAAAALCVTCHTVAEAGSELRTRAVTCEVCHRSEVVGPGRRGLRVQPTAAVAAAAPVEAPHPVRASRDLISGATCLVCHGELRNPHGVPLCTTGPEAAARPAGAGCLACHMPDGDHRFPGATPELLRRAAQLVAALDGREATVTVLNRGAGHALPTGSALRQVRLEVVALGARGEELARRELIFARVLADAAGNAPVPPWRATRVHRDTRLGPFGRRTVRLPLPPGAVRLVARLVYHRVPPPLVDRLGLAGETLVEPVEMARVERELGP